MPPETTPIIPQAPIGTAPHLLVAASYLDPLTGALYLHHDLVQVRDDWEHLEHIPAPKGTETFGDVESWTAFVKRFGTPSITLTAWTPLGLRAILDYHRNADDPGACHWLATCPFTPAPQWLAWQALTDHPLTQSALVEALEDLGDWINDPPAAALLNLMRHLRATTGHNAESELREDGSTKISFTRDTQVRGRDDVELPAYIRITIPALRACDTNVDLAVRLRVSVADGAKLLFRLSTPQAEAAMEQALIAEIERAQELLGDGWLILRGV